MVTQLQFNRLYDEKLYQADLRAYDAAVDTHETCVGSIEVRETYRGIFGGIELMFKNTADLPVELFPDSTVATAYQETLTGDINEFITQPVAEGLPPKKVSDCPPMPDVEPERP